MNSGFRIQKPSPDKPRSKSQIFRSISRNIALSLTGSLVLNSVRISCVVARPGNEHPDAIKFRTSVIVSTYFRSLGCTSFPTLVSPIELRALIRASNCDEDIGTPTPGFVVLLSSFLCINDFPLNRVVECSCLRIT